MVFDKKTLVNPVSLRLCVDVVIDAFTMTQAANSTQKTPLFDQKTAILGGSIHYLADGSPLHVFIFLSPTSLEMTEASPFRVLGP